MIAIGLGQRLPPPSARESAKSLGRVRSAALRTGLYMTFTTSSRVRPERTTRDHDSHN